jgi:sugar lactone lactonase YvrE
MIRPLTLTISFASLLLGSTSLLLLSGCGGGGNASTGGTTAPAGVAVHGTVTNGQTALKGASVQLYAAGTSGLQSAAAAQLTTAATTDATGAFSFTMPACASTNLYLLATGGDSGSGVNSATQLIAALGPCASVSSTTAYAVDEATTVAAVYALAPFLADGTHLGASGTTAGLTNAFAMANLLVNPATGTAPGLQVPANVTLPTSTLDTLANILAGCIKSGSSTGSAYSTLLTATSASNTLSAALAIAQQPAAYTSLYSLAAGFAPFTPALSVAPADWTLALKAAPTGLSTPFGIAIDSAGNAYVSSESGSSLLKLAPTGALSTTISGAGLSGPQGVAIDRSGDVWVASTGNNSVVELSSSGTVLATVKTGLSAPVAIAVDSAGTAWVANFGGTGVTRISSAGSVLGTTTGASAPTALAIDPAGTVWVANSGTSTLQHLSNAGATLGTATDNETLAPFSVALDGSGNLWFAGSVPGAAAIQGSVGEIASASTAAAPILSAATPFSVAASGKDVWASNNATSGGLLLYRAGSASAISPAAGFGSLNAPAGLAVDGSGNVWTTNSGDNTVSIFLGITTPATTPLAVVAGP